MTFYFLFIYEQQQEFDESIRISKETIDVLKDQIFGFDTFFITSQEPYEVSSFDTRSKLLEALISWL